MMTRLEADTARYRLRWELVAGVIWLTLFGFPSQEAFAHFRTYVFNEEYRTIPQGGFEVESWTKLKVPDRHATNENTFEFQEELEYGITDHWTLAHYERWERKNRKGPDDDTAYKGFKFETKYRLGEKGKYWLDPLLYLEWVTDPRDHDHPNEIEGKIVLSKDWGRFNVTYDQILESELGSGGRTEHNFTFGVSYQFPFEARLGLEGKGNFWHPSDMRNQLALGPSLSWEGRYFWVASGVAFGLNHAADDTEARIIVGVPF